MARNSPTSARSGGPVERALLEAPFHSLHREMNRLFDDIFHGRLHGPPHANSEKHTPILPDIDVSETDGTVRISAELPGVSESDIDVSLDDDVLVIRGEKKVEKTSDTENYHFVERSYGTFQRAVQLPCPVEPDKARAEFDNGVLIVTLPKRAVAEEKRKITVERASQGGSAPGAERQNAAAARPRPQDAPSSGDASPTKA